MVEHLLAMEKIGVRFPLAAPEEMTSSQDGVFSFLTAMQTYPAEPRSQPEAVLLELTAPLKTPIKQGVFDYPKQPKTSLKITYLAYLSPKTAKIH